jgi:hypothetical protein
MHFSTSHACHTPCQSLPPKITELTVLHFLRFSAEFVTFVSEGNELENTLSSTVIVRVAEKIRNNVEVKTFKECSVRPPAKRQY